ncbi:MAG: GAP family protein [Actinomycetes bacterium]
MEGLFSQVLPLALGAMVSPTLLTLQVLVLSSPVKPKLKAWALTLGAALTLILYAVLGVTVLKSVGNGESSNTEHSWTYIVIRVVCGILLLLLGLRALRGKPTAGENHQSKVKTKLASAGPLFYLPVGLVGMLTDVSSLILFLPALHDITRSSADTAAKALVFGFLYLMVMLPLLLPVLLVTVMGSKADGMLASLNRFVSANSRRINAGICFLFAAYLLWSGVSAFIHR